MKPSLSYYLFYFLSFFILKLMSFFIFSDVKHKTPLFIYYNTDSLDLDVPYK